MATTGVEATTGVGRGIGAGAVTGVGIWTGLWISTGGNAERDAAGLGAGDGLGDDGTESWRGSGMSPTSGRPCPVVDGDDVDDAMASRGGPS